MTHARQEQEWPDPLIDEVRQRRRDLFEDCGNDLHKLAEAIRRLEAEHPERVVDRRKVSPRIADAD